MKKFFFCAAALLAAISFSACSDDDENMLPATPENIAGTWQSIQEDGWAFKGGEKDTWSNKLPDEEDGWYMTYSFDKNGSYTESEYSDGDEDGFSTYGTYSISGNKITLTTDYGSPAIREITKLTDSRLVLVQGSTEAGYQIAMTFKRIK